MLPPIINESISNAVKEALIGVYAPCPYWVDKEIYDSLYLLDKKLKSNMAERYYNQCHTLEVIAQPGLHTVFLRCKHNNWKLGPDLKGTCFYDNGLVLPPEIMKKLFPSWKLLHTNEIEQ